MTPQIVEAGRPHSFAFFKEPFLPAASVPQRHAPSHIIKRPPRVRIYRISRKMIARRGSMPQECDDPKSTSALHASGFPSPRAARNELTHANGCHAPIDRVACCSRPRCSRPRCSGFEKGRRHDVFTDFGKGVSASRGTVESRHGAHEHYRREPCLPWHRTDIRTAMTEVP